MRMRCRMGRLRTICLPALALFFLSPPFGGQGIPKFDLSSESRGIKRTGGVLALRQCGRGKGWNLGIREWSPRGLGLSPEGIP